MGRQNNSATISPTFDTEFDRVTPDVLQTLKVKCQRSGSQRKDVVWSPNYRHWDRGI